MVEQTRFAEGSARVSIHLIINSLQLFIMYRLGVHIHAF